MAEADNRAQALLTALFPPRGPFGLGLKLAPVSGVLQETSRALQNGLATNDFVTALGQQIQSQSKVEDTAHIYAKLLKIESTNGPQRRSEIDLQASRTIRQALDQHAPTISPSFYDNVLIHMGYAPESALTLLEEGKPLTHASAATLTYWGIDFYNRGFAQKGLQLLTHLFKSDPSLYSPKTAEQMIQAPTYAPATRQLCALLEAARSTRS